jgi:hypothetical protein
MGRAEESPYAYGWRRYRTWSRIRLIAFVGWLPYGFAIAKIAGWLGVASEAPKWIVPWFFLVGAGVIGTSMFECPRCGKQFFVRWCGSNPFASECVNCGLPKWAPRDPAVPGDKP